MILDQFNDFVHLAVLYRQGRTSAEFIAKHLGISLRHTWRLLGCSKPPQLRRAWNRVPAEIRAFVVAQKQENSQYNCQWL